MCMLAQVRIWNWHTRAVVVTHMFEGLQRPIAVALHPSGHVLLVGFEEQIRLYHVCETTILLAFEIPVKGVVTLRDGARCSLGPSLQIAATLTRVHRVACAGESILVANPLSALTFSNGGHAFAAVTGRLVQVRARFASVRARRSTSLMRARSPQGVRALR